jgi:hypothetical protein
MSQFAGKDEEIKEQTFKEDSKILKINVDYRKLKRFCEFKYPKHLQKSKRMETYRNICEFFNIR